MENYNRRKSKVLGWHNIIIPDEVYNEYLLRWSKAPKIDKTTFEENCRLNNYHDGWFSRDDFIQKTYKDYSMGVIGTRYPMIPARPHEVMMELLRDMWSHHLIYFHKY
jgi:hypothetical protein